MSDNEDNTHRHPHVYDRLNATKSRNTRVMESLAFGRLRADTARAVPAMAAAIAVFRDEVARTTARSLERLQEIERWAATGETPPHLTKVWALKSRHASRCELARETREVPMDPEDCRCEIGEEYRHLMADMTVVESGIMNFMDVIADSITTIHGTAGNVFDDVVEPWLEEITNVFPSDSPITGRIRSAALDLLDPDAPDAVAQTEASEKSEYERRASNYLRGGAADTKAARKAAKVVRIDSKRTKSGTRLRRSGGAR